MAKFDLNTVVSVFRNTPDRSDSFEAADIEQNKGLAILSYISWFVLIPMFLGKRSAYARFHTNQGFILAVLETICLAVMSLLGVIPVIGFIFRIIRWILRVLFIVLSVWGILNAFSGKAREIPIIGGIKIF